MSQAEFITLSQNECFFVLSRAGIGAGLPSGIADELARLGIWLAGQGYEFILPFYHALDNLDKKITATQTELTDDKPATLSSDGKDHRPLSGIFAGLAASDYLSAMSDEVRIKTISDEYICYGFLAMYHDEFYPKFQACYDGMIGAYKSKSNGFDGIKIKKEIIIKPILPRLPQQTEIKKNYQPIKVNDKEWERLKVFFNKSLVPATAQSRLSGAGAGLNDND